MLQVVARRLGRDVELPSHTSNRAAASGEHEDLGFTRRQTGRSGGFAARGMARDIENGINRGTVKFARVSRTA